MMSRKFQITLSLAAEMKRPPCAEELDGLVGTHWPSLPMGPA